MAPILKPVFEIPTGDVTACNNILYNYLVLLLVGEVAFKCSYTFVGDAYHSGVISGRAMGSILHWVIRFTIYVVIAYLLHVGIWIYNLIMTISAWGWWALLVSCGLAITITFYFIVIKKRKAAVKN